MSFGRCSLVLIGDSVESRIAAALAKASWTVMYFDALLLAAGIQTSLRWKRFLNPGSRRRKEGVPRFRAPVVCDGGGSVRFARKCAPRRASRRAFPQLVDRREHLDHVLAAPVPQQRVHLLQREHAVAQEFVRR